MFFLYTTVQVIRGGKGVFFLWSKFLSWNFFSYPVYTNVMIFSIFLVISFNTALCPCLQVIIAKKQDFIFLTSIYHPLRARTIYVHPALPWQNRVIDYFEINVNYYARLPLTHPIHGCDSWVYYMYLFVCLFLSLLFIQENSFNTNVLVSQEAPKYYVHYMFYNVYQNNLHF